ATAVIERYTGMGSALNKTALVAIGNRYLCILNATDLRKIDPISLNMSSLDPSNCSQLTKDILYAKAKQTYSKERYSHSYYKMIVPYLGGAPAEDLRALSQEDVKMNISTLMKLRRDTLMSLTPSEVQGLLGQMNLPDLKAWEYISPIREWIRMQQQSDLDKLGIGLTGGIPVGYINIVTPKFDQPSSAPPGAVAMLLHLLPALLITFLTMSVL
ncbi:MSLN protein, partial [Oreotrochilus melanogaster]|nr:MSLN protein [Oreotrochilus melanogaster]